MMREPWFWRDDSLTARLIAASLAPVSAIYDAARRARIAVTKSYPAPLPVICIGNATLGGVGKTPFALMLAKLLAERSVEAHFLTRGYGGALKGPMKVDPCAQDADAVGDEALLLAAAAPTWLSRDRPAGALAAKLAGADALIMDDGFQNPSLEKTFSFLLMDGEDRAGNRRLFPAGPLREPESEAVGRADALVFVLRGADSPRPPSPAAGVPVVYCWLAPTETTQPEQVVAFCGIGRPQRFFDALAASGYTLADAIAFPDHYRYADAALSRLKKTAAEKRARLITTEKDLVRIPQASRAGINTFRVEMTCDNPEALAALAMTAIARFRETRRNGDDG